MSRAENAADMRNSCKNASRTTQIKWQNRRWMFGELFIARRQKLHQKKEMMMVVDGVCGWNLVVRAFGPRAFRACRPGWTLTVQQLNFPSQTKTSFGQQPRDQSSKSKSFHNMTPPSDNSSIAHDSTRLCSAFGLKCSPLYASFGDNRDWSLL
jgi:hypothetical protein